MLSFFKGDTININVNVDEDITNYKIRVEIYSHGCLCGGSSSTNSVQLATLNSGGSDSEILITNPTTGKFLIHVAANITTDFDEKAYLEIELETPAGDIYTLGSGYNSERIVIQFKKQKIKWTSPS